MNKREIETSHLRLNCCSYCLSRRFVGSSCRDIHSFDTGRFRPYQCTTDNSWLSLVANRVMSTIPNCSLKKAIETWLSARVPQKYVSEQIALGGLVGNKLVDQILPCPAACSWFQPAVKVSSAQAKCGSFSTHSSKMGLSSFE
jgi:hypothetical protein